MSENKKILELLKTKSSTKQEVFRITKSFFSDLSNLLQEKAELLNSDIQKEDKSVEVDFKKSGDFESHFSFSGDRLVFHMHSNIFDFHTSHEINKTSYVKEDKLRSYCGVIHVYNFLNDSFKYNRMNDVGNLVARIFINKDKHFFVEGEKQLGFLFNDFANQQLDKLELERIIDVSILFSLNFDLITPNFQDVNLVNIHQILDMNNSHKLRTSKSLGFKFSFENK
ncbi:MAG: hypothetical protein HOM24_05010 [Flavobacteriales bacterium]|nr:hypothetical protein [Flavobacteriales bacterium]